MLKLELQYFGHLMQKTDSFEKTLMLGKIEGRRRSKKLTHLKRLWCWERLRAGGEGDWGQKEKVIDFLPKSKHLLISWLQSPSTVILDYKEKDYKEIKLIHPKDHSWVFIGRTDVEAGNSSTLATWCKKLTHLKRLWCWERLRAEGAEGEDWMASPTQWTWVWVNCGSWWWTGRPGVLQSMGSQRVGHDWATGLNWLKDTKWNFSSNVRQHPLWYSYFMIIKKVSVNRLWQLFFFML